MEKNKNNKEETENGEIKTDSLFSEVKIKAEIKKINELIKENKIIKAYTLVKFADKESESNLQEMIVESSDPFNSNNIFSINKENRQKDYSKIFSNKNK